MNEIDQKKFKSFRKIFYLLWIFLKPFIIVIFCLFSILLKILREQKKNIEKNNTTIIEDNLISIIKLNKQNLDNTEILSYISDAMRNTHYYGNLRIKYVGFNFTFLGFFTSIIAIYVSLFRDNPNIILCRGWPMIVVFFGYLVTFLVIVLNKYDTIKFDHAYLRHFSSIMDKKDYPYIKSEHIKEFNKLIGADGPTSMRNNLKTLLLQYQYQRNYSRLALLMRKCLIYGCTISIIVIIVAFSALFI